MRTTFTAHHVSLTPAIRQQLDEKLGQPISRLFPSPLTRVRVSVGPDGHAGAPGRMRCHVTVWPPKGPAVNITQAADDLYVAINQTHDRIVRTLADRRKKGIRRG